MFDAQWGLGLLAWSGGQPIRRRYNGGAPDCRLYPNRELNNQRIALSVQDGSVSVDDGQRVEAKFRKLAEQAGVNYTIEILADSSIAEAILRLASEHGANLIIVGSRGVGAVRRATLGSVSHHLVTHASVPVLVVPPAASNRPSTSA